MFYDVLVLGSDLDFKTVPTSGVPNTGFQYVLTSNAPNSGFLKCIYITSDVLNSATPIIMFARSLPENSNGLSQTTNEPSYLSALRNRFFSERKFTILVI